MRKCSIKRPQAFWGTLIGLAGTVASSLINANQQKKYLAAQTANQKSYDDDIKKYTLAQNQTNVLNDMLLNEENFKDKGEDLIFNEGGKISTKAPFKITSGGTAIPIGNQSFLLRGRSHNTGGIDMTFGKNKRNVNINAEGGEVVTKFGPRTAMIFSDRINLGNGLTPAKAVRLGFNPTTIADIQQSVNGNHTNTPVKGNKNKAELGDWINFGADITSALATGLINRNAYKRINTNVTAPQYYEETPVILDTKYHNRAQLANLDRMRLASNKSIGENTSSSSVAQARMRLNNLDYGLKQNELLDYAANQEANLRNIQAELNQGVRQRNTANRNIWAQQVAESANRQAELKNDLRLTRGANWIRFVKNLNTSGNNLYNAIEQRKQDYNTLRAYMAASNHGTVETFLNNGGSFGLRNDINDYNTLKNKNKTQALSIDEINLMNNLYGRFTPLQRRLYRIG